MHLAHMCFLSCSVVSCVWVRLAGECVFGVQQPSVTSTSDAAATESAPVSDAPPSSLLCSSAVAVAAVAMSTEDTVSSEEKASEATETTNEDAIATTEMHAALVSNGNNTVHGESRCRGDDFVDTCPPQPAAEETVATVDMVAMETSGGDDDVAVETVANDDDDDDDAVVEQTRPELKYQYSEGSVLSKMLLVLFAENMYLCIL